MLKITQLPVLATTSMGDQFPIVDDVDTVTKRSTIQKVYDLFKTNYDSLYATIAYAGTTPDFYQYSIVRTVASGNLTVAIKNYLGNDPTPSVPVKIQIGGVVRTITSALSFTYTSGANSFNAGSSELAGKEIDYFVYLRDISGSVTIDMARIPYATVREDFDVTFPANEKFSNGLFFAPTGTKVVNIGRFNATLSAGGAYTWSIPATSVIINSPTMTTRAMDCVPTFGDLGTMTVTDNGDVRKYSRYIISNNTVIFNFGYVVTAGGTLGQSMSFSLPFSSKYVRVTGVATLAPNVSGFLCSEDVSTKVFLRKYNSAVYDAGAQWITGSITYEI